MDYYRQPQLMKRYYKLPISIVLSLFILIGCKLPSKNKAKQLQVWTNTNSDNKVLFDSSEFDCYQFDFDRDGYLDAIYSHQYLAGDSLFVYRNINETLVASLKTINFSEDGLYKVDSINAIQDTSIGNFAVYTHFMGSGGMKQNIYFKYETAESWKITCTTYKLNECLDANNCFDKYCVISQNLELNDHTMWENYNSFDSTTVWIKNENKN